MSTALELIKENLDVEHPKVKEAIAEIEAMQEENEHLKRMLEAFKNVSEL